MKLKILIVDYKFTKVTIIYLQKKIKLLKKRKHFLQNLFKI